LRLTERRNGKAPLRDVSKPDRVCTSKLCKSLELQRLVADAVRAALSRADQP
jgi:hypothetical protein